MAYQQRAVTLLALLLALYAYQATAWCAVVVGSSDVYGGECGAPFSQLERNATWHLKKLTVFSDHGCITGIKQQLSYKGSATATSFGSVTGSSKSISLGDSEYIAGVDIGVNSTCITLLRLVSGKGQVLEVGSGTRTKVKAPRTDAYIYGFAGWASGSCPHGVGQLQFIWAIEDCSRQLLSQQNPSRAPNPSEAPNPSQGPGVPRPPAPIQIPQLVPTPVPVMVPVPTPVNVTIPQYQVVNISVPVPVPVPTPVDVPNPVPTPVPVPINVTIPVPTPVPIPTPIPIPTPVPVQSPSTNVQIQVPGSPPGFKTPVAAICDTNQDLMVFSSASSLKCVFDFVGAQTGRILLTNPSSSKFVQYAGVRCYDLGCQQVWQPSAPAPATVMSYGKGGGMDIVSSSNYRSYDGSGPWNDYNSYMAQGRRRLKGWNPFASLKGKGVTEPVAETKKELVYVPVPVPVPVQVQVPAPAPNVPSARCSFAVCVPKVGQQFQQRQQQQWQPQQQQQWQPQQQEPQWLPQQQQQTQQQQWTPAQDMSGDDNNDMPPATMG